VKFKLTLSCRIIPAAIGDKKLAVICMVCAKAKTGPVLKH